MADSSHALLLVAFREYCGETHPLASLDCHGWDP